MVSNWLKYHAILRRPRQAWMQRPLNLQERRAGPRMYQPSLRRRQCLLHRSTTDSMKWCTTDEDAVVGPVMVSSRADVDVDVVAETVAVVETDIGDEVGTVVIVVGAVGDPEEDVVAPALVALVTALAVWAVAAVAGAAGRKLHSHDLGSVESWIRCFVLMHMNYQFAYSPAASKFPWNLGLGPCGF